MVKSMHDFHNGSFGRRVLKKELEKQGVFFSERKISRIMKQLGIQSKYGRHKGKNVYTSEHTNRYIKENLYAQLSCEEKKQNIMSMDFTEQIVAGKKIYTCGVISVNNKALLGYSQGSTCTTKLAIEALKQAFAEYGKPYMVMTDRGAQFTSKQFYDIMNEQNVIHSMSRPHTPVDNCYIETFWKTMKTEIGKLTLLNEQTYAMVVEYYVDYYNNIRPHSSLGYNAPLQALALTA